MASFDRSDDRLTTADFAGRRSADGDIVLDPKFQADREGDLANGRTDNGIFPGDSTTRDREGMHADRQDPLASTRTDLPGDRDDALRSETNAENGAGYDSQRNVRGNVQDGSPLLSETDIGDLRARWSDIQAEFVDEPRRSVEKADELVASAMQRLAEGFANERASLEKQWDSGSNVSTEDLRVALQRYRSFFGKLINAA